MIICGCLWNAQNSRATLPIIVTCRQRYIVLLIDEIIIEQPFYDMIVRIKSQLPYNSDVIMLYQFQKKYSLGRNVVF